jgi:hypothetical protein
MYKSNIFLIALTLVINSCITSRGIELDQTKILKSGWMQDSFDTSKKEGLFYFKKLSEASDIALKKKSGTMMQESCINNAIKTAKPELISELSQNLNTKGSYNEKQSTYIESSVSKVNIQECQPIAEKDERVPFSEWGACECIFYAKISGGKDFLISKVSEL